MKFGLDFRLRIGEDTVDLASVLANPTSAQDALADPAKLEGLLVCSVDGKEHGDELVEPIVRLADQWVRKLPWIIAGDTETLAYRNSEHCFAFVPEGESVELSFFVGTESEVEEYEIDPTNVRLDLFVGESIKLVERLVKLIQTVDADLLERSEDCRDLARSLDEGRRAWREYQLKQRR